MKNTLPKLLLLLSLVGATNAQALEAAKIPSNFDMSPWVIDTPNPAMPNYPRNWGEFPSPCSFSNLRYDDPIRSPGQFNAAPLHLFFGNTLANANSTYDSLRKTGEGTCFGGPVNRSSFYMPAMIAGSGKVVLPDFIDVYYRGVAGTRTFPRGLKMIFGPQAMSTSYNWTAHSARYAWTFHGAGGWHGKNDENVIYKTLVPSSFPEWAFQNASFDLLARAVSPDCWDGVHLDMPDHFSHLAYSGPDASVTGACPTTHPIKIPQVTVTAAYNFVDRADLQGFYLSSDKFQLKNDAPGTNWYVGMIPAWDSDIESIWVTNLLNRNYYGPFSKLGDGRRLETPPTSKIFGATQNPGVGRNPFFLWSLSGTFFMPGSYVPVLQRRVNPPAR